MKSRAIPKPVSTGTTGSAVGIFHSNLGGRFSEWMRKPAVLAAAIAGAGLLATQTADGALAQNQATLDAMKPYGAAHNENVVFIEAFINNTIYHFSGINLGNGYGLIPQHAYKFQGVAQPAALLLAGTGDNYMTDRGVTSGLSIVAEYPGWVPNGTWNAPDLAIVKFDSLLPAPTLQFAATGSVTLGEVTRSIGFGWPATSTSGYLAEDGAVRAFNAPITSLTPVNVDPNYYYSTRYSTTTGLSLNGRGSTQDSGALVTDSYGLAIGMVIGGDTGTGPIGGTFFLDLTKPNLQNYIAQVVPEPTLVALIGLSGTVWFAARKKRF